MRILASNAGLDLFKLYLGEKFYAWIEEGMVKLIEDVEATYERLDVRKGG